MFPSIQLFHQLLGQPKPLILYSPFSLTFHSQSVLWSREFHPNYFSNIPLLPHCYSQNLGLWPHYFQARVFLYCFIHLRLAPPDPFFMLLLKVFLQNVNLIILFHSLNSYTIHTVKVKLFRKATLMVWWLLPFWLYLWLFPAVSHPCCVIPTCHCEISSITHTGTSHLKL